MLELKHYWHKLRHKILPASKSDVDWRFDTLFKTLLEAITLLQSLSNRMESIEAKNEDLSRRAATNSLNSNSTDMASIDKFVRLAYRAILKRDADSNGLEHFSKAIIDQRLHYTDVIEELMTAYEYEYTLASDPQFITFRDNKINENSLNVSNFQPYSINDLSKAVPEFQGIEYYEVHKQRFVELVNYLAFRQHLTTRNISVLECGSTLSTKLIKSLLPDLRLSISDFKPLSEIEAASTFPMIELIEKHYQVDFMRDDLETLTLEDCPQFDVILLCEVIEHLLVNPKKVIRFLLRHLSASGQLYMTTPNIFQHSYVSAFRNKINPLPLYPEEYSLEDAPHFHLREYGMGELLRICKDSGASIQAYYFSSCWDNPNLIDKIPDHELSNLVIIVARYTAL